jgi:Ca2+-binding EF-hand superfamily protein
VVFRRYDTDADGLLSLDEMNAMLQETGVATNDEDEDESSGLSAAAFRGE